ncbi:hypothetical protein BGZ61DRAFT_471586 [Ilyonectria robusta]|uniref:uncharacterized protein n=1 Tax=Ilyonectria robusta TaxID=1079257 RepID=UPI001E8DD461|nr:uncharacterized protein BGZ61DRAFT_471586 [Ilyonectria robusta]KAH8738244.1 hypothetical protein BGZ61DRAFT_471586 [Ilyonectria robusta]
MRASRPPRVQGPACVGMPWEKIFNGAGCGVDEVVYCAASLAGPSFGRQACLGSIDPGPRIRSSAAPGLYRGLDGDDQHGFVGDMHHISHGRFLRTPEEKKEKVGFESSSTPVSESRCSLMGRSLELGRLQQPARRYITSHVVVVVANSAAMWEMEWMEMLGLNWSRLPNARAVESCTLNLAMVHPREDTTQDQIASPVSRGYVPGSGRMACWSTSRHLRQHESLRAKIDAEDRRRRGESLGAWASHPSSTRDNNSRRITHPSRMAQRLCFFDIGPNQETFRGPCLLMARLFPTRDSAIASALSETAISTLSVANFFFWARCVFAGFFFLAPL